ncbi:Snf7-domain-containing protein [Kockovaella imperatae]|uniref:Snf7-domain-containing protein n=1 Tax=Kockovaella imperatae TaxID=4999 RepID=A0A1Y1UEP3_9TREE|nr:Snf7-domain-containing protein [Kockovaella imperatae]ORX36459.1 Snf7-domain-containing protein [Kockovaella imperatae]
MNVLDTLFGRSMTPAERLRKHQSSIQKAVRELERERAKLEGQEKKTMMDIKKNAKNGNMNACKILAKDLVRTRHYIQKFTQMRVQLQAVSLRMQTLRSNEQMATAMKGATRAMAQMNRGLNLPQIQRIMNEFEKESSTMDMKEEIMSEAVDDAMEGEEEGEGEDVESDKILKEVFDEIGMNMNDALTSAPTANPLSNEPVANTRIAVAEGLTSSPVASQSGASNGGGGPMSSEEADLQRRLDALRRD